MKSQTISKSPIRDPFQQAQSQYESRQTISQSPAVQGSPIDNTPMDFSKTMESMGIDHSGFQFNELGKMQLVNMLKQKYGDDFQQNPEAMRALSAFDSQMNSPENVKAMNQGLANANRTLGALFGGG